MQDVGRIVLGIETSCDETAVCVLGERGIVLSHEVLSQAGHSSFGGIVPEIAARAHYDFLHLLVERAMSDAKITFSELAAIAVTGGPGLIGSLIVGVMFAKGISYATKKPLIVINHLEAHALVARMSEEIEFPFLVLLISGGHCLFLLANDVGNYKKLGESLDDSLGEAFDKVSRMLGLGYPGGKIVENKSLKGCGDRFSFPRALLNRPGCDFSFSGLKTAVRNLIAKVDVLDERVICDICASFQLCVSDILVDRTKNAFSAARRFNSNVNKLVVTGGVASNNFLRGKISRYAQSNGFSAIFPPSSLCTDNGIMVGWAGIENLRKGYTSASLDFAPVSRWPLDKMNPISAQPI